jgi:hypothetical protein
MKPLLLALTLLPLAGHAQMVYRCPGPPVLYTDQLSAKEAEAQGCKPLDAAPVSVVQTPRRAAPPPTPPGASAPRAPGERVDPTTQKQRDSDRRGVLEAELRSAEAKLAELKKEYADGQPERRGDERNYQKYLDRVETLKAAVQRQEADIAAIKRELAKVQ